MRDELTRAWVALIALSAASTMLALVVPRGTGSAAVGAAILALAWLKARVILRRYLGLAAVPDIGRGFDLVLALVMLGALGLYLAA